MRHITNVIQNAAFMTAKVTANPVRRRMSPPTKMLTRQYSQTTTVKPMKSFHTSRQVGLVGRRTSFQ